MPDTTRHTPSPGGTLMVLGQSVDLLAHLERLIASLVEPRKPT